MILSFRPRFIDKIKDGSKIHTIREDKTDRWKPGMKIHFATGIRTKNYNQFFEGECNSVQKILIRQSKHQRYILQHEVNWVNISIDGKDLFYKEIKILAFNDGFDEINNFLEFFPSNFEGKIIHWTDFRY